MGEMLRKAIPELQDDICKLKGVVPQLRNEIMDVRSDMALILSALRALHSNGLADECAATRSEQPGNESAAANQVPMRSKSTESETIAPIQRTPSLEIH